MNDIISIPNNTEEKNRLLIERAVTNYFKHCSKVTMAEFYAAVRREAEDLAVCMPDALMFVDLVCEMFKYEHIEACVIVHLKERL